MSKNKIFCPLPIISLSLEAGLQRRLCCHDTSQETESLSLFDPSKGVGSSPLNKKVINEFSQGLIPKNCEYCFELEANGNQSPRKEYLQKFKTITPSTVTKKIHYLDITIDNECNLKCRSCRPSYSKKLTQEFEKFNFPYNKELINSIDLIEAKDYLKFLPLLAEESMLTITGGEPFFSNKTKAILDYLIKRKQSHGVSLRIFTNLSILPIWFSEVQPLFKSIELIISLDGSKELAEYIRYPSKWKSILKNLESLTEKPMPSLTIKIHFVLQAYNIVGIAELITELLPFENFFSIVPNITKLTHPTVLKVEVIPKEKLNKIIILEIEKLQILQSRLKENSFTKENHEGIMEIVKLLKNIHGSKNNLEFIQFLAHTQKIDKQRKQSFSNINQAILKLDKI
ncbi:MAG: MoaA/NifB/PqqE/SkfB family radical SAM enzyme [Bacteriovoracaceae bacterium]|jgi:MoaA/NifB/PqqE/SkfB family radical SAM enzyme